MGASQLDLDLRNLCGQHWKSCIVRQLYRLLPPAFFLKSPATILTQLSVLSSSAVAQYSTVHVIFPPGHWEDCYIIFLYNFFFGTLTYSLENQNQNQRTRFLNVDTVPCYVVPMSVAVYQARCIQYWITNSCSVQLPEETDWYQNWFLQNKYFGNINMVITHNCIQNIPGPGHCSTDLYNRKWLLYTHQIF